jgi:hypothetical protein
MGSAVHHVCEAIRVILVLQLADTDRIKVKHIYKLCQLLDLNHLVSIGRPRILRFKSLLRFLIIMQ